MGLTTKRLTEPALSIDELPPVDFAVLSHHHGDHFDRIAARDFDHDVPIITEPHAARKLRKQGFRSPVPLSTWQSWVVTHADGDAEVRVTSLPGQHAPRPLGYVVPPVMGSLLDFVRGGQRLLRLYITGDTLMHDGIGEIAERFGDIDLCLIHLGGTRIAGILLTMDGCQGSRRCALSRRAGPSRSTTTTTPCSSRRCPTSGGPPRQRACPPKSTTWAAATATTLAWTPERHVPVPTG
jgi:L-ascorbate metabolism protein UlaG (beta-lactamase superfamily)